jgi:hypothetical protein
MRLFNHLVGVGALVAAAALSQAAYAQRVCKEVCNGPICKQECIETEGRGDRREDRREERREERREDRREERRPGIELRLPVPEILVTPRS